MKVFTRVVLVISVIVALVVLGISFLPLNSPQRAGKLILPGLSAEVSVLRDYQGMAYIQAQNMEDLMRAQGFLTAQDRLFSLELTRLMAGGRISELVGEKGRKTDILMRSLGFLRQGRRHEKILDEPTRRIHQAYVEGVNSFIAAGKDIPLEFSLAGIKPGPWSIADSLAIAYYMGWNSAANVKTEMIARMLTDRLGPERARELFPLNINPDDPLKRPDTKSLSKTKNAGEPLPLIKDERLAILVTEGASRQIGSNNWAVSTALSTSGAPQVVNDPHLDARILPGPWHPVGLILPDRRAVGATIPGLPGIIVGRTSHLALGVTNSYADTQDLYIETIDPDKPGHYLEGKKSLPFASITEVLRIKDGKAPGGFREEEMVINFTSRGPVVTDILPGQKSNRVLTVRWAPYETMLPTLGLDKILSARSAKELKEGLKEITVISLNFVFADNQGNIGWQTTGRVPLRSRGDGTMPLEVVGSEDNWSGWIPWEKMPGRENPTRGWIGTCNHKTVTADYPYYFSSHFSPSYRYRRLAELLDQPGKTAPQDHWRYMRDTVNVMARQLAPVMARALIADEETRRMGEILTGWDFRDQPEAAAPLIFQAVYHRFARLVFRDELGEPLTDAMLANWYFWQERLGEMVESNDARWFDDTATPDVRESRDDLFRRAAREVSRELGARYRSAPEGWQWGKAHQVEFVNPLRREGLGKGILGGGSHPMGGSQETLYRASYEFNRPFNVSFLASLRMVADLGDPDKILAVIPGGVSGRFLDRHFRDQVNPFMEGKKSYWWFSDSEIAKNARYRLALVPK